MLCSNCFSTRACNNNNLIYQNRSKNNPVNLISSFSLQCVYFILVSCWKFLSDLVRQKWIKSTIALPWISRTQIVFMCAQEFPHLSIEFSCAPTCDDLVSLPTPTDIETTNHMLISSWECWQHVARSSGIISFLTRNLLWSNRVETCKLVGSVCVRIVFLNQQPASLKVGEIIQWLEDSGRVDFVMPRFRSLICFYFNIRSELVFLAKKRILISFSAKSRY